MAPEAEKRIIVQCMRERMALPQRIQNAPELKLGLELYFGGFFDLNTCRQTGWSVSPIPWSSIAEYAKVYEFDTEQTDDLFFFVRKMDEVFINHHSKKDKQPKTPVVKEKHGARFA